MDGCYTNERSVADRIGLDGCSEQLIALQTEKKSGRSSMTSYNNLMSQVEPSTSSEESEADKLIQENNKLREQNLKLQKILAIAGVKFDGENEISGASRQSITCTPASSTFSSDIQDLNVSGGCQHGGADEDYNLNSNNNVECSTDAIIDGNKGKRTDDDHHGGSEVLLCDTSTNVDFAPIQEEHGVDNELFAELQVDTTVDIVTKSSNFEDQGLTISLPNHSEDANIKVNTHLSRPGMSYLNPDGIVDISPPLPMTNHNCFPGSRAITPNVSAITAASTTATFTAANQTSQTPGLLSQHSIQSGSTPILNLQRMDSGMQLGGHLSLMGGFNNGILINQLGQQVSFLQQQQQPPNILLNSNQGLMASQTKLLSPNTNLLSQNAGLIAHQGNLLMSNGNGIFQQFAQPVSNLNLIPQAAPLFTGNQMKAAPMHGPMTLNVVPQNSSRDFLMLPNGKLVPISTQPSILPVAPPHPAMQSIITGFPNQIRLQTPQFLGNNSIQRCSQSFSLLPNQIPILAPSDQTRLTGQNQISVNGLPVLAPGQIPQTLQIFNQLPQVSPQQNISSSSINTPHAVIPPQNFVLPGIQPCMTAYLTPEGTIVLSLHQQNSKKISDDSQKSSQSISNNFLQEKKVQRRIMPKPSNNDPMLNPSLSAAASSNSNLPCHITVTSSTGDNLDITEKSHNSGSGGHQSMYQSGDFIRKNHQTFDNSENFVHVQDDVSLKKKGNGRKRESGGAEKKKRPKQIVQKIENACSDGVTNAPLPGHEKSDLSDLQDISCCMLNETLNDQFSQNLNDDDQGDINQFSDLIVMDNEVTSNPKTTLEEHLVSNNCQTKDSVSDTLLCESLAESTSTFSVSSTTVSCSENVIFPANSDSYINQNKKTKKKRKKLNHSGLLMIEPVAEFIERKNVAVNDDTKPVDKKEEADRTFDSCSKSSSFAEVECSVSTNISEKSLDEVKAPGGLKHSNSSSDMVCPQVTHETSLFYPMPDRVEEGTQTIKLEKRKKNKLNKKIKNKTPEKEESKKKIEANSENSNVNIPDRLSFLEDQLMDVVDKVESMVAQSTATPADIHENKISDKVYDMKLEMKDSLSYCQGDGDQGESRGKRKNSDVSNDSKPSKKLKLLSKDDEDTWGSKLFSGTSKVGNVSPSDCSRSLQAEVSGVSNMPTSQLGGCQDSALFLKPEENVSNNFSSPSKKMNKAKDLLKNHKSIFDSRTVKTNIELNTVSNAPITTENVTSLHYNPVCQASLKDNISGTDPCKSARHISIASLAWSSGIAKTSISRSNKYFINKSTVNEIQPSVESILRSETEHDFVKAVDSIVEELDQKSNREQNNHLSEKPIGHNESKTVRNEPLRSSENCVAKNTDSFPSDKISSDMEDSKPSRDNGSGAWIQVTSSCVFQMTATNSPPNLQSKCHHISSDAAKYDVIAKDNLNTHNALIITQNSGDLTSNGRNKNEQIVIHENVPKNLDLVSYEESNSANKFITYPSDAKESNNSRCFKSEATAAPEDAEKKTQNTFGNNLQNVSKHSDGNSSMAFQNSRQKGQIKIEQQTQKNSRHLQEGNIGGSNYYNVDESGKKFGYPNIFAPPLFTDPYSPSCAQFSTFPVSAGPSFEPSFMLPPCLPFEAPVASASFNYYGDSSRYSHFGHSSLATKPHSFSSIAPEYPSCSLEPKKAPNSNFSNRSAKDEALKNKTNASRKDLFVSSELPIDQFIIPCGSSNEKVTMSGGADISHYGVTLMNPITSKSYTSKQDVQTNNRNKSSNTFLHARNSSNSLMSPPLHHHPLLFDQKNPTFATGFDFNSTNLNTLVNGCGIMDQSFSSNTSASVATTYDRECVNTSNNKNTISDEKKVQANSGKTLPGNKMYDNSNIAPKTISLPAMSIPLPITSSTTQTKSTSKSSRSSKKSTSGTTKTNSDNNSCMFSQTQIAQKSLANNEVMSYFSNNFSSGLTCRSAPSSIDASKFQGHYVPGSFSVNGNSGNLGLRTSANIGMDYMSTQILGSSGSIHSHHHHPHFGFNHFFPEMDIPNGYLKFGNPSDIETMPLHHQHKNLHQPSVANQPSHSVLSDINPFFHPPQYSFEGSSSYFNQSACSAGPFTMSSFNIRMPRVYHQNSNSF